jgi:hypothetical protein
MTDAEFRDLQSQVRDLSDRQAINDVLVRYTAAFDAKDIDLLRTVFHPDGIDHHQGFDPMTAETFLGMAEPMFASLGPTAHYVAGTRIELDGDSATARYRAVAFHRLGTGAQAFDSVMGARIVDRLERRNGEWRISHRRVEYDWNRDADVCETWGRGAFGYADMASTVSGPEKSAIA